MTFRKKRVVNFLQNLQDTLGRKKERKKMRFSTGVVAALAVAAPMAMAFVQPSLRSKTTVGNAFSMDEKKMNKALTELKMAFHLKEGQVSNMFEGPAPLVKERDACGVGFIANTQNGGTWKQASLISM